MSVEFVNQERAGAEAQRAVALLRSSDKAKVDAWFAMQSVADQVGPPSNVGVRGIGWGIKARLYVYTLRANCVDGALNTTMAAPKTLEEARHPDALSRATTLFERKIEEKGGRATSQRPHGTARALIAAVGMSDVGREWLAGIKHPADLLLRMVRIADAYGRDGVYPPAGLTAHSIFATFEDRAELIRAFPGTDSASAKAMSLRAGESREGWAYPSVKPSAVKSMATRTGTTRREARVVMQAAMAGRSERKLMRLVREAVRWAHENAEVAR